MKIFSCYYQESFFSMLEGSLQIYSKCLLVTQLCLMLCDPMDSSPPALFHSWGFPGKNTGVGCHFLLHEIFPTEGLNLGLPHCR